MMDIAYELSESPEYYSPLMQYGLIEMMMQAVLPNTDGNLAAKSDAINILNNQARIADRQRYLKQISWMKGSAV